MRPIFALGTVVAAVLCARPLVLSGATQRAPASFEIALVANAQGGTVALVEIATQSIAGTVDINPARVPGTGPGSPNFAQDTDVSPDGRTLYVSRGYVGDVAAFDIASGRMLWTRPLNTVRADHMTLTPDGRRLFVSAMLDNVVYRIDTARGSITGQFATGAYPHDNQMSKDGRHVYNTSIGPLSAVPRPASAAPLKAPAANPFQITVVDAETLAITDYAALVGVPELALISTIPVGDAPGWAETADAGRLCLIANTRSDDLSIISIPDRKEVRRLPIGHGPKHITVARLPETVIAAVRSRR